MKKMLLALLIVPALAWGQTYRPLGIRTTTGALDGYTPGYVSNWTNVLGDAPHNASVYARSNGVWVVVTSGGTNASAWVTANSNAVQYMMGQTNLWDQALTNGSLVASNAWSLTKIGNQFILAYGTNAAPGVEYDPVFTNWVATSNWQNASGVTNIVNGMTQGLAQASSIPSTNGFTTFPDVTNVVNVMTQGLAQASSVPSTNSLEQASHATATFVPYTGATAAVNLGGQAATNAGTIHGTNIVAMGTLNVSGAATLSGAVTHGGVFTNTGAAQLKSTLGVDGAATFNSTMTATAAGTCSNSLKLGGVLASGYPTLAGANYFTGGINQFQGTNLPTTVGAYSQMHQNVVTAGNTMRNRVWALRKTVDAGWTGVSFHDALDVDVSFYEPGVNTRCWYERNPYNETHKWGSGATTWVTVGPSGLTVGTAAGAGTFSSDASGMAITGAGYMYLNQSGLTYSQQGFVARGGIANDGGDLALNDNVTISGTLNTGGNVITGNGSGITNLPTFVQPIRVMGQMGWAEGLATWFGPEWYVAFSDADAQIYANFIVREGGSYKICIVFSPDNANTSKTASGLIYAQTTAATGVPTDWNVFKMLNWDLAIPDTAYTLTAATYSTAFTIAANSECGVGWLKDNNAGGAAGSMIVHGIVLVRQ